ncbi:DUF6011 domain-containing protein [Clostridium sp. Cult2]|uniref:DUF6011 domain-containing protein n=1 Tax=Clostridium sp. Cult2 TaxID=2079003 RepID=UPI001F226B84|nr:DUF6011 domain-containing protein [Clostridium sp. Cult2]MCF6466382.1 hypothetical protein [Clostridium sp. Cult2]
MSDNYSIVCKRCGRKLTSEVSRNRGYGSYCYSKIAKDSKKDNDLVGEVEPVERIEGQVDIYEIFKEVSGI